MSRNDPDFSDEDWSQVFAILQNLAPKVLRNFRFSSCLDDQDIIQEVACRLLRLKSQGILPSQFSRGLLAIMLKRSAIDEFRRCHSKKSHANFENFEDQLVPYSHSRSPILNDLAIVFEKLPKEERLFLEEYLNGVSIHDLAESSGVSYSATAQRLSRLKKKLRIWLIEMGKRDR